MKVFISYHRADTKEREYIEELLKAKLINSNHKISADKIKQLITPAGDYDIFISHSHKDLELAKGL